MTVDRTNAYSYMRLELNQKNTIVVVNSMEIVVDNTLRKTGKIE